MSEKILLVDDDELNLTLLESILTRFGYDLFRAYDGEEAVAEALRIEPDLILMDVMMPKINGFEALRALKNDDRTKIIPVIIVTSLHDVEAKVCALEAGAEDFVAKPIEKLELMARVKSLLKVKAYNDFMLNYQKLLEQEVENKTRILQNTVDELNSSYLETIYLLSRVSEFRDELTGGHINRVSAYSALLARNLGLTEQEVFNIRHSSVMHDIGKIAIPDSILLKPGKLNTAEWRIMQQHTIIGEKLLKGCRNTFANLSAEIALTHHEKWDGTGYPYGLKREQIPLSGRIVALADVYDALISNRPYKAPFTAAQAEDIIRRNSGSHFDPAVVRAFWQSRDEFVSITPSTGSLSEPALGNRPIETVLSFSHGLQI